MKKLNELMTILLLVLSLVFILTACTTPPVLPKGDINVLINKSLPDIEANENGKVDILMLTDLHILSGNTTKDKKTIAGVTKLIDNNNFDLVVLTGDVFEGYNKKSSFDKPNAVKVIAEMFEDKNQYWAFTSGNNDGEYCGSTLDIMTALSSYPHALVADSNVGGVGNYTIDIIHNKNIAHTLIFMDSRMRDENNDFISISKEQREWYSNIATNASQNNIFTSLFMHIPFIEFLEAYKNGSNFSDYNCHSTAKTINTAKDNSLLLNENIIPLANTKLIATGHTHGEDYAKLYKDICFLQVRAAGYNAWNDNLPNGGAVITIDINGKDTSSLYSIKNINF